MAHRGVRIFRPGHPNADNQGYLYEHVLVASIALGRALPTGAVVHHVNENHRDNRPENLVICESSAYHLRLHQRLRVLKSGGNPDSDKWCTQCKQPRPRSEFSQDRTRGDGLTAACMICKRAASARYYAQKRREA